MAEQAGVWRMFAHAEEGTFTHLGDRRYVEAHELEFPIVAVEVRLVEDADPEATHWGWIDAEPADSAPEMIWPWWPCYSVCFMYGPKAEEAAGRGRTVRLAVSAVQQDGDGR